VLSCHPAVCFGCNDLRQMLSWNIERWPRGISCRLFAMLAIGRNFEDRPQKIHYPYDSAPSG
jgi:hypothetical protein